MYVSSSCTCTDLINSFVCGPFGLWSMVMLKWIAKDKWYKWSLALSHTLAFGVLRFWYRSSIYRHFRINFFLFFIRLFVDSLPLHTLVYICLYLNCTYRPLYGPSTFVKLPSPDTTATRSLPLNHFNECKFPHDWTSIGHSSVTVWPRNFDIVLSGEREKKWKTKRRNVI